MADRAPFERKVDRVIARMIADGLLERAGPDAVRLTPKGFQHLAQSESKH